MRLVINYKKCRRAGQCSYLHPELFKVDSTGAPVVLVEHPGEEQREAVEEAVVSQRRNLVPAGRLEISMRRRFRAIPYAV